MSGKNTVRTPIVNKNGVATHVHKNVEGGAAEPSSRVKAATAPPASKGGVESSLSPQQAALLKSQRRLERLDDHGGLVSGNEYRTAIALEKKGLGTVRYQGPSIGWFNTNDPKTEVPAPSYEGDLWRKNPDEIIASEQPIQLSKWDARKMAHSVATDVTLRGDGEGNLIVRSTVHDVDLAELYFELGLNELNPHLSPSKEDINEGLEYNYEILIEDMENEGYSIRRNEERPGVYSITHEQKVPVAAASDEPVVDSVKNKERWDSVASAVRSNESFAALRGFVIGGTSWRNPDSNTGAIRSIIAYAATASNF